MSNERIVLMCSNDASVLSSMEALSAVGYSPVRCSSLRELQLELSDSVVSVVLDASLPKDQTFAMYRFLRTQSRVPFLVLLPPPSADQPSWVMDLDHGDQEEFARQPITTPELILRLNALLVRSGIELPSSAPLGISGSTQASATLAGYGKVVCAYGGKGGIGKTTLAVHLAVGLALQHDARVALIDGDLWMGDCVAYLNLTATRTILDATINGVPNDPEVWTHMLMEHASGVRVLAPPVHLEDVERVPDGAVAAAAQALRRYFDYVIVDLDDVPSESTLSVLDLADQVLVVMTPELSVVRNTMRLLTTGADIGLKDRVRIVLNRADSGLDAKQIESIIPSPVIAHIPSDGRLFVAAMNNGKTVFEMDSASRTPARKALEGLVHQVALYGRPQTRGGRNGLFGGLTSMVSRR